MPLDFSKIKPIVPDLVYSELDDCVNKFQINTPLRMAHFLAQCAHESGGFKAVSENLNYSASGLMKVFKKYFPTQALADQYARKPEMIANRVYASRMGNGDEASGDGYKFRGRGYIQLTGRTNYTSFKALVTPDDTVLNPDLVATKYPLLSGAWFFSKNGLNAIADKGATDSVVTSITQRVNGGTNGLDDRIAQFNKFYPLLK